MRRSLAGLVRLGLALTFFLTLVGWAVSSPVGSSPDDDYHLTSIWCSPLSDSYPCSEVLNSDGDLTLLVPRVAAEAHACFAFQPDVTADCARTDIADERLSDRANQIQQLYPSGFYTVQSIFAGSSFDSSVLAMRLFNALLATGLLVAFVFLSAPALRTSALVAVPVILVPMGFFVIASTNPSGWTLVGCLFFFLFMVNALIVRSHRRAYWPSLVLAVLSALMAIVSRVDGSAFIAIIALVVAVLMFTRRGEGRRGAWIVLALSAVTAVVGFLAQGSGPVGSAARIGDSEYVGGLLFDNILEVPGFLAGIVGLGPLGWADTRMPGVVSTAGLVTFGAVAFWGLQVMNQRKSIASVILLVATLGLPVYVSQQERIAVLDFIQARYLLPLAAVLLVVLASALPQLKRDPLGRVPHAVLTTLLATSSVVALWVNFHRYALGAEEPFFSREMDLAWAGLLGSASGPLLIVAVLASIAFFILAQVIYGREQNLEVDSPERSKT